DPEGVPATVSTPILTGVLRKELGFHGLIVTDAMDMQGLAKQFPSGIASVRSLEAGADVLLMPPDPEVAIRAVLAAIKSGKLTRKRIDQSALKILTAKARLGLNRSKLVDLDALSDALDSPDAAARAQDIADRAVTLVKDDKHLLPLDPAGKPCLVLLTEARYSQAGRVLNREARRRAPDMPITRVDPTMTAGELDQIARDTATCGVVVAAAFVSVALGGNMGGLVTSLMNGPQAVVLIALGSPYLLRSFPNVAAYLTTYSTAPTSEVAAVKAMFGEIPITGRLPVTIPGLAKYGDGLERAKGPIRQW
ncbi:MAG: glycoside hydrolase family 3 N-terminal domain-containing protein, partial [Bryobacteraceae bacterium]